MTTFVIVMSLLNILVWVLLFLSRKKAQKNMIETVMKISLGNIKQEVEKILIEINKVTDSSLSLIENRMNTLREVIALADKRVSLADKEFAKKEQELITLNRIDEIHTTVKKDNATVKSYVENAYKVNSKQKNDGGISLFAAEDFNERREPELSLKDKVLDLFNQGIDVYLIAEKLDSSVAEVQTIINLFGH